MEGDYIGKAESAFISKTEMNKNRKNSTNNATPGGSTNQNSKNNFKTVKCYNCKQVGHYKNKCPKLKTSFSATAFSATFLNNKFNRNDWYIDSGASSHLTANEHLLTNISDKLNFREITIANNEKNANEVFRGH